MKLYHYSTWNGEYLGAEGIIQPSSNYLKGGPKLVWLTSADWEPSVRAKALNGFELEGPSSVEAYKKLQIPCWRFTVEVPHIHKIHYPVPGWVDMLKDGIRLGSDISLWHWYTKPLTVIKAERL